MSGVQCKCGKVASHAVTRKEGANHGRWFYACGERGCNYFAWDDQTARGGGAGAGRGGWRGGRRAASASRLNRFSPGNANSAPDTPPPPYAPLAFALAAPSNPALSSPIASARHQSQPSSLPNLVRFGLYDDAQASLAFKYDQAMIDVFKNAVESRKWDGKRKLWHFPLEEYETARRAMEEDFPDYRIDVAPDLLHRLAHPPLHQAPPVHPPNPSRASPIPTASSAPAQPTRLPIQVKLHDPTHISFHFPFNEPLKEWLKAHGCKWGGTGWYVSVGEYVELRDKMVRELPETCGILPELDESLDAAMLISGLTRTAATAPSTPMPRLLQSSPYRAVPTAPSSAAESPSARLGISNPQLANQSVVPVERLASPLSSIPTQPTLSFRRHSSTSTLVAAYFPPTSPLYPTVRAWLESNVAGLGYDASGGVWTLSREEYSRCVRDVEREVGGSGEVRVRRVVEDVEVEGEGGSGDVAEGGSQESSQGRRWWTRGSTGSQQGSRSQEPAVTHDDAEDESSSSSPSVTFSPHPTSTHPTTISLTIHSSPSAESLVKLIPGATWSSGTWTIPTSHYAHLAQEMALLSVREGVRVVFCGTSPTGRKRRHESDTAARTEEMEQGEYRWTPGRGLAPVWTPTPGGSLVGSRAQTRGVSREGSREPSPSPGGRMEKRAKLMRDGSGGGVDGGDFDDELGDLTAMDAGTRSGSVQGTQESTVGGTPYPVCEICWASPASSELRPCGHGNCGECAKQLKDCPRCGTGVKGVRDLT